MRASNPMFLLVILPLAACSDSARPSPEPQAASQPPDGAALYRSKNCLTCHGADRAGTLLAPSLLDISAHWAAEDLASFLREPKPWLAKNERLAAAAASYRSPMPPTFGTDAERLALAQWLLAQP
jgi:cytochrome c551/c552